MMPRNGHVLDVSAVASHACFAITLYYVCQASDVVNQLAATAVAPDICCSQTSLSLYAAQQVTRLLSQTFSDTPIMALCRPIRFWWRVRRRVLSDGRSV